MLFLSHTRRQGSERFGDDIPAEIAHELKNLIIHIILTNKLFLYMFKNKLTILIFLAPFLLLSVLKLVTQLRRICNILRKRINNV